MTDKPQPVVLVVLDGFGMSPITEGNAIVQAKTPFLDWAIRQAPKALLHASGAEVGLDWGEMGNSEVGHINIGTGRIVMQDLPRINRSIEDESFYTNAALIELAKVIRERNSTLHVIGLASSGGVHAHIAHLLAMLEFAKRQKIRRVGLHLITDGRDTPPQAFDREIDTIQTALKKYPSAVVGSISGRYYAMDRDKRWDRTEQAYQAIMLGKGRQAADLNAALQMARNANETDEFILPTALVSADQKPLAPIQTNDAVVFINFRPDRARQLTAALTEPGFRNFSRSVSPVKSFLSFTSYGQESSATVKVAFFAEPVSDQLAAAVAQAGFSQFHVAETEKYAHVTYFFNGGLEKTFPLEERCLIPSPKVATYDLKPAMSAEKITQTLTQRFANNSPDLTVVNFANPDMVGHTGNFMATQQAIEIVDQQLAKIQRLCQAGHAILIITADHGNAEQLIHPETHEIDKEHTTNPVPLFVIPPILTYSETADPDKIGQIQFAAQSPVGVLADIAPTILDLLGLDKPAIMTGQSLRDLFRLK